MKEGTEVEERYSSTLALTSALDWVGCQSHAPAALPSEMTQYPIHGGLGGTQGRSGRVRQISSPSGFDAWSVQRVVSRYNDYAIPAHEEKVVA